MRLRVSTFRTPVRTPVRSLHPQRSFNSFRSTERVVHKQVFSALYKERENRVFVQQRKCSSVTSNKSLNTTQVLQKCEDLASHRQTSPLSDEELSALHSHSEKESSTRILLGELFLNGTCVKKDKDKAIYYFRYGAQSEDKNIILQSKYYLANTLLGLPLDYATHRKQQHILDPEDLQFVLGNGYVLPKNSNESSFNFKQWLKEERKKNMRLKQKQINEDEIDKRNEEEGLQLLESIANEGYLPALTTLALFHLERGESEKAIHWLHKGVEIDNVQCIYELGRLYYEGSHVAADLEKSVQLFTKAAKLGDSNSIYWLGYLYHNGIGVEKDTTKAVALLNTAVSEQHSGAMFYLSQVLYHWEILLTYLQMYRVGDSVPQSTEKMMELLQKSAELGDSDALFALGDMYFHGVDGVDVDYPTALKYFTSAAKSGNADACVNQGVMYFKGLGTEVDYEKAFYAYQNAVLLDENHVVALYSLYHLFNEGLGVPKNEHTAQHFFERAQKAEKLNNPNNN